MQARHRKAGSPMDRATPNLPARDFETTSLFYASLGFIEGWRDDGWMILRRGDLTLEFFPYPDLDPLTSSFSCCLRLDDLDAFMRCASARAHPNNAGASRASTRPRSRTVESGSVRSSIPMERYFG